MAKASSKAAAVVAAVLTISGLIVPDSGWHLFLLAFAAGILVVSLLATALGVYAIEVVAALGVVALIVLVVAASRKSREAPLLPAHGQRVLSSSGLVLVMLLLASVFGFGLALATDLDDSPELIQQHAQKEKARSATDREQRQANLRNYHVYETDAEVENDIIGGNIQLTPPMTKAFEAGKRLRDQRLPPLMGSTPWVIRWGCALLVTMLTTIYVPVIFGEELRRIVGLSDGAGDAEPQSPTADPAIDSEDFRRRKETESKRMQDIEHEIFEEHVLPTEKAIRSKVAYKELRLKILKRGGLTEDERAELLDELDRRFSARQNPDIYEET